MTGSGLSAFPSVVRIGDTLYIGGRLVDDGRDIEAQTAAVFELLVAALEPYGATMRDLVNLRTYYVYDGPDGPAVTTFWNRMTAVRLRYLADPGPAATALRVHGVPGAGNLIGVDGVATRSADRQRLMPEHSWNWTIPTPFSQGWRIDDKIYVGGQLAADRCGKAIATSDVITQTMITLDYIHHVLLTGGQDWSQVAALRICFKHEPDDTLRALRLADILRAVTGVLPEPRPALTAIGIELLYEGLLLEIDAIAHRGAKHAVLLSTGGATETAGFPTAIICGDELHIGGLAAIGAATLSDEVEFTFRRLREVLDTARFDPSSLVKITLFQVIDADAGAECRAQAEAMTLSIARRHLSSPGPVVSFVSVPSLPRGGQRFQLDGVAVIR